MSERVQDPRISIEHSTPSRTPTPSHAFEMDDSAVLNERTSLHDSVESQREMERRRPIKGLARHTLGLILLLCVVFLWTAGNFLGSSIFADGSFAKPFFLTYLNTGMFVWMLLPRLVKSVFRRYRDGTLKSDTRSILSKKTIRELMGRESSTESLQNSETEAFLKPIDNTTDNAILPTTTAVINAADAVAPIHDKDEYLPLLPTARLAFAFCILWFGANYFAMACLQYTTVASTTILTSTSSVWTLLVGAITRTEKFTWRKLCGVLGSLLGIILISRVDLTSSGTDDDLSPPDSNGNNERALFPSSASLNLNTITTASTYLLKRALSDFPDKPATEIALGDALALLSAIIYGFYTIVLKRSTLKAYPLTIHMPTFFGLVGLYNIILLAPLFPILHYTHAEPFQWPPTRQIWTVLVVNSFSSLLSDVLWAYAMVFTSPLVVTVGLSLTIPLSLVGEMIIQSRYEGWIYWVGAMVVVGSFVFVEREEVKEEKVMVEEMEASGLFGMGRSVGSLIGGRKDDDVVAPAERGRDRGRPSDDLEGLLFDNANVNVDEDGNDGVAVAGPSSTGGGPR